MKSKISLFATLLLLLLAVVGCTRFHPPEPKPTPELYEVTFKVEGQAPRALVVLYTPSHHGEEGRTVALPFTEVESVPSDKAVMLFARHVEGGEGELVLTISVNGKVVKSAKSTDTHKGATAQIGLSTIDLGQH